MDKETIKEIRMAIQENRVDDFKRMASENSDTLEVVTFFGTFLHDAAILEVMKLPNILWTME